MKEIENNFDDTKPKIIFFKPRLEKIREIIKEIRRKFSKSKINKIRRNLYGIENEKNISAQKIKEIEKNLLELEKIFFNQKRIMIMMILNIKE